MFAYFNFGFVWNNKLGRERGENYITIDKFESV